MSPGVPKPVRGFQREGALETHDSAPECAPK